jgi:nitroimidazol reductase NimA-like FMN-containing flavoprotein (pyridoxamine 5'-phosphate oxidase superfamily)
MEYNNEKVRRQDRLLDETTARHILENGEYGVLSMATEEGEAYGIPLNYVWDKHNAIYIHCALEGRKIRNIAFSNNVSFSVVGKTNVVSNKFTTGYESIVLRCNASVGLPPEERMKALELIIDKYSPDDKEIGMKYVQKSFDQTEIIRLDISEWSGKAKVLTSF